MKIALKQYLLVLSFLIGGVSIVRTGRGGGGGAAALGRTAVGGGATTEGAGEAEAIGEARGDEGVEGLDLRAAHVGQSLHV